jgi:hypothetical protein
MREKNLGVLKCRKLSQPGQELRSATLRQQSKKTAGALLCIWLLAEDSGPWEHIGFRVDGWGGCVNLEKGLDDYSGIGKKLADRFAL